MVPTHFAMRLPGCNAPRSSTIKELPVSKAPVTVPKDTMLDWTIAVVTAYLARNAIAPDELTKLLRDVHQTLAELGTAYPRSPKVNIDRLNPSAVGETPLPAVPIELSIKNDRIICLEDGVSLKMLKRYIMNRYQLTPEAYRAKWGLPEDYPMNAPTVIEARRQQAASRGFGKLSRGKSRSARSIT